MADAFIYDAVRTPRGKGKSDGSLHEVTALNLATQALGAIKRRNLADPSVVDDVVLGCVDPVGEAGGDIARAAALDRGLRQHGRRRADQPLLRLRPRRDQLRVRAGDVRPARHDDRRRRRIDEPRRHGRLGRRVADGSGDRDPDLLPAAGHLGRPDRDEIRLLARRRRRLCGREPEALESVMGRRQLQELRHPGEGRERHHDPGARRAHAADHDDAVARAVAALVRADGRDVRLRRGGDAGLSGRRSRQARAPCRQFVRHRRRRGRRADRQQGSPAPRSARSRARASGRSPISAPSPPSCSPARST